VLVTHKSAVDVSLIKRRRSLIDVVFLDNQLTQSRPRADCEHNRSSLVWVVGGGAKMPAGDWLNDSGESVERRQHLKI